jgi:putative ABC transport system permease protein
MNILQLTFKQMRQRALSTWLTTLSILLGVALGVLILILNNNSSLMFGQTDFGYDALVGPKGSQLQLVFNSVYHIDTSPGNIPYSVYESMLRMPSAAPQATTAAATQAAEADDEGTSALPGYRDKVRNAVPFCVGDTYNGKYRIVGTLATIFGCYDNPDNPADPQNMTALPDNKVIGYRKDMRFKFAQGRCFNPNVFDPNTQSFEAIIGSAVADSGDLKLGSIFQATHGELPPGANPDVHNTKWKVVGVLAPTYTSADLCVYTPLLTFYTVEEHSVGLKAQWYLAHNLKAPPATQDPDDIDVYRPVPPNRWELLVPKKYWEVSGIFIETRGGATLELFNYDVNRNSSAQYMCVKPASVMLDFFDHFLKHGTFILLLMSGLVTITAAVSIMTTIYNSVTARIREIAIVRALGATRGRVLALVCLEAGLVGLMGAALGVVTALIVSYGIGIYVLHTLGQPLHWLDLGIWGILYVVGVIILSVLAGLVPGLKAYKTSVAANLVTV